MSDTDLKALRQKYDDHLNNLVFSKPGATTTDVEDAAWDFIKDQFQIAVPHETYDLASTNLATLMAKVKALPSRQEIILLLETMLWDRGRDVRLWPEDEAEAYRELGWEEGSAAARHVMFTKAADALGTRIDLSL